MDIDVLERARALVASAPERRRAREKCAEVFGDYAHAKQLNSKPPSPSSQPPALDVSSAHERIVDVLGSAAESLKAAASFERPRASPVATRAQSEELEARDEIENGIGIPERCDRLVGLMMRREAKLQERLSATTISRGDHQLLLGPNRLSQRFGFRETRVPYLHLRKNQVRIQPRKSKKSCTMHGRPR